MAEHRKSEVFLTFSRLGLYAFGGPTAHFALFRSELAERRKWVSPSQYDAFLALCQFLPGPGSSQMAAVLGWVRAGPVGAGLAMLAFALPSLVLMTAAGIALPLLDQAWADRLGTGLMAGVAAVVAGAVLAMGKTTARQPTGLVLALAALAVLLTASGLDVASLWLQPGVIAATALGGLAFKLGAESRPTAGSARPARRYGAIVSLCLFAILLVGLPILAGENTTFLLADTVFRAGSLVFGGGHVVLPLLEAGAVPALVDETDFLAGYGLAQAVPGPLFSFAAFVGAASAESPAGAILLATVASALIFLPGLLLVFAVLPVWSTLQGNPRAQGAITGAAAGATAILTAAFFDPVLTSLPADWRIYVLALMAFAALQRFKLAPPIVMGFCTGAGLLLA